MSELLRTEIAIIGAGAAGLMTAERLAGLGYGVMLFEKDQQVGSGPSLRNEGWLHRGTVHAGVIKDEERALDTARKVIYGHDRIIQMAPEAVEDLDAKVHALFVDETLAKETEDRWDRAGVWYRPLSKAEFRQSHPELNHDQVGAAYEAQDKSVDFRLLYRRLLHNAQRDGTQLFLGAEVIPEGDNNARVVRSDGTNAELQAEQYIYTTGLAAARMFDAYDIEASVRYWKSHSVLLPRTSKDGFFYVDPYEASLMPHGNYAIACKSEDDVLVDTPDFAVDDDQAELVFEALVRAMPGASDFRNVYDSNACLKPDITYNEFTPRSVGVDIQEPVPGHLIAFPGKVTQSPYMADTIAAMVHRALPDPRVASRPIDNYAPAQRR